MGGGWFKEGGFQIVERAAFSSRGNLLLQWNSYLKNRHFACYCDVGFEDKSVIAGNPPLPKTPHSIFPTWWHGVANRE